MCGPLPVCMAAPPLTRTPCVPSTALPPRQYPPPSPTYTLTLANLSPVPQHCTPLFADVVVVVLTRHRHVPRLPTLLWQATPSSSLLAMGLPSLAPTTFGAGGGSPGLPGSGCVLPARTHAHMHTHTHAHTYTKQQGHLLSQDVLKDLHASPVKPTPSHPRCVQCPVVLPPVCFLGTGVTLAPPPLPSPPLPPCRLLVEGSSGSGPGESLSPLSTGRSADEREERTRTVAQRAQLRAFASAATDEERSPAIAQAMRVRQGPFCVCAGLLAFGGKA